MAKPCTFESYSQNEDPLQCCKKLSTQKISEDVVDEVNKYWEKNRPSTDDGKVLWVVYIDLCDPHAELVQGVYSRIQKPKGVKDEMHVQIDKT